ncbi:beta-lactamase domain protein [Alkaliphilus metalliredigens QYMF]|uniref:Beta-lactamase domain protein n=1 Tax=Alkaliphilus metalliredigens (strain QYMF) TaxID=293826 RepID=A6TPB2_ALKMQ|nr:MBL fold metallo-hydrolase [Alkaliphilus metalliredigens]ABR48030.1 beta-lactamase domain protein [Alkaliphilus metalliredigens QYMF]
MKYIAERMTKSVYVIAIWDEAWGSFNNCYVIKNAGKTILIDTGKVEHVDYFIRALGEIGIDEHDIDLIIVTHVHKDHIGGSMAFKSREKRIHKKDYFQLDSILQEQFTPIEADEGWMNGLNYFRLGHHTPGSLVLYLPAEKVLFMGDFHCFFGVKSIENGFVYEGVELRDQSREIVSGILQEDHAFEKYNLREYFLGLKKINTLQIDYLATGHGVVLKGGIKEFIEDLLRLEPIRGREGG